MSQVTSFTPSILPPGTVVETLTGNSGGAVGPNGSNNINVIGDGITTNVVGDLGTHTLTISSTGVLFISYKNVNTSPYVVLPTDDYLSVDSSIIPIIIQLPNAATLGRTFIIKDRIGSAMANNISVTTVGGGVTIDSDTDFIMDSDFQSVAVLFNGTNYEIY